MDYSIFNVRTILRVRVHTGGVAHRQRVSAAQHFDSEKLSQIFLVLRTDSNLWSWSPLDFEADSLPVDPPRPHVVYMHKQRQKERN